MQILEYNQVDEFYAEGKALDVWDNRDLWASRRAREGTFYADLLRKHNRRKVLDCSAASGFHCFELEEAGYSVEGADKVAAFVRRAMQNARKMNSNVRFQQCSWSELSAHYEPASFDSVLCLGSSLHHNKGKELKIAVENMFQILERGGILVVDQRNYHKLFRNKPKIVFDQCGVTFLLEYPSEREIIFHIQDQRADSKTSLKVFVTFEEELILLLEDIGFDFLEKYGDFKDKLPRNESDWIQYVFKKP